MDSCRWDKCGRHYYKLIDFRRNFYLSLCYKQLLITMSASGLSNYNAGGQGTGVVVIQSGVITKVAATALNVACPGLIASDQVYLSCLTRTAGTANTPPNEVITTNLPNANPVITFTSPDAVFAGSYAYSVQRVLNSKVFNAP